LRCRAERFSEFGTGWPEELEVSACDRVLVLLPKESLIDQNVDIRRQRIGEPTLEQGDGPRVLFASKDQFGFALATSDGLVDRHRGAEHDRHHTHGDQQRGHGIAALRSP
jgi:hypothetical protein